MTSPPAPLSPAHGRLCVLLAALLWSFSGTFVKVLTTGTRFDLGLDEPRLSPQQIACFRTLLGGFVLLLALRPREVTFRPLLPVLMCCFAVMNVLFVTATSLGTAAEAILLQYTAPLWAFVGCVWWLKEPADRRSLVAILIGVAGVGVIIVGGWQGSRLDVVGMAL